MRFGWISEIEITYDGSQRFSVAAGVLSEPGISLVIEDQHIRQWISPAGDCCQSRILPCSIEKEIMYSAKGAIKVAIRLTDIDGKEHFSHSHDNVPTRAGDDQIVDDMFSEGMHGESDNSNLQFINDF